MPDTKMIVVKSRGLVHTSRGLIQSPIVSAYRESVDRIWEMLTRDRADVYEVLRNKKEIQLNVQNFDADNNALIRETPVAAAEQKPFTGVETTQQTPVEESKQETAAEKIETQNQTGSGGNNQQQKNQQNTWKNQSNKGNKNKHGNKDRDSNGEKQSQNQTVSEKKKDAGAESNPSATEKADEKSQTEASNTTQAPVEVVPAEESNKQEPVAVDKAAESAALAVEPEEI